MNMGDYQMLVKRARVGDEEAFGQLYEMVYKDMYRFALYALGNRQDGEDVVGDAVADAFEGIGKLKNVDAFRGWIFRILSNKCRRKLKEYVNKTVDMPEDLCAGGDFTEDFRVREAFGRLSDEERLILSMLVFAGYSSRETGQILHKSDNTIRSIKSRSLGKLAQLLEG
jgi:RNA polymerase sigma-70 factor (ECF subfamily)